MQHQFDIDLPRTAGELPSARRGVRLATRRAADWRRQLARALSYALGQSSPEQAEALIAEYERREQEGPDFLRQRPDSAICEAPVVSLDRNERVRLVTTFRALTRKTWADKETGRHRGAITRTAESVFFALLYLVERYGRVRPSLTGLAHLAMCCRASAVTAIAILEEKGFVTRIRRLRKVTTPLGFETVQDCNAYKLHMPRTGLGALAVLLFSPESNSQPPSETIALYEDMRAVLDPQSPLAQALERLGEAVARARSPA